MVSSTSPGSSSNESVQHFRRADEDISLRTYPEGSAEVMPVIENWGSWLATEKTLERAITTLSLLAWNLPAGFHQDPEFLASYIGGASIRPDKRSLQDQVVRSCNGMRQSACFASRLRWDMLKRENPCPTIRDASTSYPTPASIKLAVDLAHGFSEHLEVVTHLPVTLCWMPIYDSFFQALWREQLKDLGIDISIRPQWDSSSWGRATACDRLQDNANIVDVVFSATVPLSHFDGDAGLQQRLKQTQRHHPQHSISSHLNPAYLSVPILVVEYTRFRTTISSYDSESDIQAGLYHLRAAMEAALEVHLNYSLPTPVMGLLISRQRVTLCVSEWRPGQEKALFYRVPGVYGAYSHHWDLSSIMENAHLQTFFTNLRCYVQDLPELLCTSMASRLNTADLIPKLNIPQAEVTFPPQLLHDPSFDFLIRMPANERDLTSWLDIGHIRIEDGRSIHDCPQPVQKWLQRVMDVDLPLSISEAMLEQYKSILTRQEYNFMLEYWLMDYNVTHNAPEVKELSLNHVCRAMKLAWNAHEILLESNCGNDFIPWHALYRSLFASMITDGHASFGNVAFSTPWSLHQAFHRHPSSITSIVPDCTFALTTPNMIRLATRWISKDSDNASMVPALRTMAPELSIWDVRRKCDGAWSPMVPMLITEHVIIHNDPASHKRHLVHLATAMKSALGIHRIHLLDMGVVGLLIDRNIIQVVVGWASAEGPDTDTVSDIQIMYDVSVPADALRLHIALSRLGTFLEEVQKTLNSRWQGEKAAAKYLIGKNYVSWKESQVDESLSEEEFLTMQERLDEWLCRVANEVQVSPESSD